MRVLSGDARRVLDQIRDRLGVRPAGSKLQVPAEEHLRKIHQALGRTPHPSVRATNSASRDSEDVREIDPYHLTALQRLAFI
jgi:hypothetical protein